GVGRMLAVTSSGTPHQFGADSGWSWWPATDSVVSFNDNVAFDAENFRLSTADLQTVDVSAKALKPKLVAKQANFTYFPSHHKTGVVYTTDQDKPGLYVARVY